MMLSDSACAAGRLASSGGTKKNYHDKRFIGNEHLNIIFMRTSLDPGRASRQALQENEKIRLYNQANPTTEKRMLLNELSS
jgi:hypothetical protein